MLNMGVLGGYWVVPGIVPLPVPTRPTTPGTPLPAADVQTCMSARRHGHVPDSNMVVGLISVAQLSLVTRISGFRGMTEVYNLSKIDRIINHFSIPGNK